MSKTEQINISENFYRTKMHKDYIVDQLRENGFRITKQRLMLLDIILEEDCSCCKEIYYRASKQNSNIGTATVYRMVNLLEEIGAISRKNIYRVMCEPDEGDHMYLIELDDHSVKEFSDRDLGNVIQEGLRVCGYLDSQKVIGISIAR